MRLLGLEFHEGDTASAWEALRAGGYLVAPSAPVLVEAARRPLLWQALAGARVVLPDSGYLALLARAGGFGRMRRLSGLTFLRSLLEAPLPPTAGALFRIDPDAEESAANQALLRARGWPVGPADAYVAPRYDPAGPTDSELERILRERRPAVVLINLGGGVQEPLAAWLAPRLPPETILLCTGAALAFLSGRQARIPGMVDRLYLGWLARCLHHPGRFVPRYLKATRLAWLVARHGRSRPSLG